jgi:hypothetical protein
VGHHYSTCNPEIVSSAKKIGWFSRLFWCARCEKDRCNSATKYQRSMHLSMAQKLAAANQGLHDWFD